MTTGYRLDGEFSDEDRQRAISILSRLNRPATLQACTFELGRLRMLTKIAAQGDDDIKFQIAVMAEELVRYPLDVVRDACRFWPTRNKFFPAWQELREMCEERVLKRRCLLEALQ